MCILWHTTDNWASRNRRNVLQIIIYEYIYWSHRKHFINSHHTVHVMLLLVTWCNTISCRMRPEWASSTDINRTPVSKLVVYRWVINDVTQFLAWPYIDLRESCLVISLTQHLVIQKNLQAHAFWQRGNNFTLLLGYCQVTLDERSFAYSTQQPDRKKIYGDWLCLIFTVLT